MGTPRNFIPAVSGFTIISAQPDLGCCLDYKGPLNRASFRKIHRADIEQWVAKLAHIWHNTVVYEVMV